MATLTTAPRPYPAPIGISAEFSPTIWLRNMPCLSTIEQISSTELVIDEDQLYVILSFLDGYSLARCSRVCTQWRNVVARSNLWQGVCRAQFGEQAIPRKATSKVDWKQKFVSEPHLRYDGLYYLRVSYWSKGSEASGYKIRRFSYYRYLRFFNDGSVHYALLNDPPAVFIPKYFQCCSDDYTNCHIYPGRYKLKKQNVSVIVAMRHMVAGIKVKISTTIPGANNRLQFSMLASLNETLQVDYNFKVPAQAFCFLPVCW